MRPVSKKMQARLLEYHALVDKLRSECNNRSELSGEQGDWLGVSPHHILGRVSNGLDNPFNIIFLTDLEHKDIHSHNTRERKQALLEYIRPIREKQGYLSIDI